MDLNSIARGAKERAAAAATSSTMEDGAEEKTWMQEHLGPGSTIDSFLTGGFNSLTMNLMDEVSAGVGTLGGRSYEEGLKQERGYAQAAQEAHPNMYMAGELAGAIAPALATGGASAGTSLAGAALKAAGTGAAQAGVSGFGAGEGTGDRFKRAATDAAIGGATGGILGGAARIATKGGKLAKANAARKQPNEFKQAANEAYTAIDDADIVFDPQVMKDTAQNMKVKVSEGGFFDPVNNKSDKKIAGLITQFENVVDPATRKGAKKAITAGQPPADSMMTLSRLERFRQTVKEEYKPGKPQYNFKLNQVQKAIDEAIATHPEAEGLAKVARAADRQARQSDILDELMTNVKADTSATYSGTNLNNKYRQAFAAVLKSKKKSANFDDKQLDAMRYLVKQDTFLADAVRKAGRLAPSNGGVMSILNLGLSHLNPGFLAVSAAGEVAQRTGNKMTANLAEGIANQVAGHTVGPIATQAPAAVAGPAAEGSSMLGGMMMGAPASEQQQGSPSLPLLDMMMQQRLVQ